MPEFVDFESLPPQPQPEKLSRVQKIMLRLFPPAQVSYQETFPFSTYSGPAGSMVPILRSRQRLKYGEVLSPELMTNEERQGREEIEHAKETAQGLGFKEVHEDGWGYRDPSTLSEEENTANEIT